MSPPRSSQLLISPCSYRGFSCYCRYCQRTSYHPRKRLKRGWFRSALFALNVVKDRNLSRVFLCLGTSEIVKAFEGDSDWHIHSIICNIWASDGCFESFGGVSTFPEFLTSNMVSHYPGKWSQTGFNSLWIRDAWTVLSFCWVLFFCFLVFRFCWVSLLFFLSVVFPSVSFCSFQWQFIFIQTEQRKKNNIIWRSETIISTHYKLGTQRK